jgi:plastocyanin
VTLGLSNRLCGAAAAAALGLLTACGGGGGGNSPTGPVVSGNPGPVGATITIGANGSISPSNVTITAGQSVAFVNNDSRRHDMSSDPHPTHTDCPQMNAVGALTQGQTRNTNGFPTARTCGFHDHDNPDDPALRGRIAIQ